MKRKNIVIIALITISFLYMCYHTYQIYKPLRMPQKIEFSMDAWDENPSERSLMVESLLQKYDFIGLKKEEVIKILGKNRSSVSEYGIRYETGGGFFEDEIFQFLLDENGIVKSYGIAN